MVLTGLLLQILVQCFYDGGRIESEILTSKVFTKIRTANTRYVVNEGSSRSTKTFSIIQYLIYKALEEKRAITIARAKLTWLKASLYMDFLEIISDHFKIYSPKNHNKTEMLYTFDNGSFFRFLGLDESQKVHGLKSNIAWINEAVEANEKSVKQIALRTTYQIIIDYNPSFEQHWIYDSICTRDDCTLIHSTYKDNPFLEQAIVEEIERLEPTEKNIEQGTADEVSWKIYGLGIRAAHRGLIFSDIQICKELPPEEEWKKSFYGLDFGYTNDPSALVLVVYAHGNLYFKEIFYERGLVNRKNPKRPDQKSIEQRLEEFRVKKDVVIWADSAEPKSIQEIANAGWYNIRPVHKGPDSVVNGIETIKRYKCFIEESSLNLIKEKNNYKWREDKDGKTLNQPIDAWNHGLDAMRYVCMMEFRLEYEDKYKAIHPKQKLTKGKTLQSRLAYYENRRKLESQF